MLLHAKKMGRKKPKALKLEMPQRHQIIWQCLVVVFPPKSRDLQHSSFWSKQKVHWGPAGALLITMPLVLCKWVVDANICLPSKSSWTDTSKRNHVAHLLCHFINFTQTLCSLHLLQHFINFTKTFCELQTFCQPNWAFCQLSWHFVNLTGHFVSFTDILSTSMTVSLIFCQLRHFVNFVDILLTWLRHSVSFTDTFCTDILWILPRHFVDILSTLLRHFVNFTETFWRHFVNFTAVKASASQTLSLCTSSGWPSSSRQSHIYLHKTKGNQLTDTALPFSWTSDWPQNEEPGRSRPPTETNQQRSPQLYPTNDELCSHWDLTTHHSLHRGLQN